MTTVEGTEEHRGLRPDVVRHRGIGSLGQADFPGCAASVSVARRWARELLAEVLSEEALDDAIVLLSELVTNSVLHSDSGWRPDGSVTVFLAVGDGIVHCEVIDDGSAMSVPRVRELPPEGGGGRGLWMVNAMADAWGFHHDEKVGNAVWFQIRVVTTSTDACRPFPPEASSVTVRSAGRG